MDSNITPRVTEIFTHNFSVAKVAQLQLLEYHIRNTPNINKNSSAKDIQEFQKARHLFMKAIETSDFIAPKCATRAFESIIYIHFREGKIEKSLNFVIDYKNYLFRTYKDSEEINKEQHDIAEWQSEFKGFDVKFDDFGKTEIDEEAFVSAINFITLIHFNAFKMGIEYEKITLEITPLYELAGIIAKKHLDWRSIEVADAYFQYAEYQVYRLIIDSEYEDMLLPWSNAIALPKGKISEVFRLSAFSYGTQNEIKSRVASILADFYDFDSSSKYEKHSFSDDISEIKQLSLEIGKPSEDLMLLAEHLFLVIFRNGGSKTYLYETTGRGKLSFENNEIYKLLVNAISESEELLGVEHPLSLRLKTHKLWLSPHYERHVNKQETLQVLNIAKQLINTKHEAVSIIKADLYRLLAAREKRDDFYSHEINPVPRSGFQFDKVVAPGVVEAIKTAYIELENILGKNNIKTIRADYELTACRKAEFYQRHNWLGKARFTVGRKSKTYGVKKSKNYDFLDLCDLIVDYCKNFHRVLLEIRNWLKFQLGLYGELKIFKIKTIFLYFVEYEKIPLEDIVESKNVKFSKAALAYYLFMRSEELTIALPEPQLVSGCGKNWWKPHKSFFYKCTPVTIAKVKMERNKRAAALYRSLIIDGKLSITFLLLKSLIKVPFRIKLSVFLFCVFLPTGSYVSAQVFRSSLTYILSAKSWIVPGYTLSISSYIIGFLMTCKAIDFMLWLEKGISFIVHFGIHTLRYGIYPIDKKEIRAFLMKLRHGELLRMLIKG